MKKKIRLQLWLNTQNTIKWFSNMNNKYKHKFLQINIDNYCSSINPTILNYTLIFAKKYTPFSMKEINIILTVHKSVINFNNKLWVRKDIPNSFNISMGVTDSVQIIDIKGIYSLANIQDEFSELMGVLYKDDALFVVKNT